MDGKLDAEILKKLGLNRKRMETGDAAFFLQLVLLFCNPFLSGIQDDLRMPFFMEEERFNNVSKFESGRRGTYGHGWMPTTAKEFVNVHGVTVCNGVKGSTKSAIHHRWMKGSTSTSYDYKIANTMRLTRFGELKCSIKLCHNGSCPQRGQVNYDPAYKFDIIWKTMVHNCNSIILRAKENQTIDEIMWSHSGHGEAGSGITGRLRNKKVNKGGQTTIISDSRRPPTQFTPDD